MQTNIFFSTSSMSRENPFNICARGANRHLQESRGEANWDASWIIHKPRAYSWPRHAVYPVSLYLIWSCSCSTAVSLCPLRDHAPCLQTVIQVEGSNTPRRLTPPPCLPVTAIRIYRNLDFHGVDTEGLAVIILSLVSTGADRHGHRYASWTPQWITDMSACGREPQNESHDTGDKVRFPLYALALYLQVYHRRSFVSHQCIAIAGS